MFLFSYINNILHKINQYDIQDIPNMSTKTVTFSDIVLFFPVPYRDDCRMGTWKTDSVRFEMRIIAFEHKFRLVLNKIHGRTKVEAINR